MEIFSALHALCEGNSPVTGESPSQRPVTRSFDIFFGLCLNKRLSKQSWGWWIETPSCPLWRHCNGVLFYQLSQAQTIVIFSCQIWWFLKIYSVLIKSVVFFEQIKPIHLAGCFMLPQQHKAHHSPMYIMEYIVQWNPCKATSELYGRSWQVILHVIENAYGPVKAVPVVNFICFNSLIHRFY